MAHLFSPLTIVGTRLANRIVMAPYESGHASADGFVSDELYDYYVQRAHGNVGLIITEPARVVRPAAGPVQPHLGMYDDVFIPRLRHLAQAVHGSGSRLLVMLEAPATLAKASSQKLHAVTDHFLRAAWRVQAAECDGIMLSAAEGGILHMLTSPLTNTRTDDYGGSTVNRLRLAQEIVEGIREWLGTKFLIGFRLVAEEFAADGISLHDARVYARRLSTSGVNIIDVMTDTRSSVPVAHFPGWRVPLAVNIKRVIPDTPVISSGLLGDPHLADSVIRDGSVDLVMLGRSLRLNPYWAHIAYIILTSDNSPSLMDDTAPHL